MICIIRVSKGFRYFYATYFSIVFLHVRPMVSADIHPLLTAHAAVLLVLLPRVGMDKAEQTPVARADTLVLLSELQQSLGAAIRVLRIDEASHPAVVHSFDGRSLPAFVLIRDGAELWRQQGLPQGKQMAALLLSKLLPSGGHQQLT
jgi:hypothetical protein